VWIVRLALHRPYTFVVMAALMAILGATSIFTMATDIFPAINIPVASIVWTFTGLSPQEMADRVVTITERALTTTVNDIEHIESTSYNGVSVIRIFFQPTASIDLGIAQTTGLVQTLLRTLPPGIFPPGVLKYDASTVPILQLALHSPTLTEAQLYDYAQNFIRTQLATVAGAAVPIPYGGKLRQVMVDIEPDKLFANGLSATDVSNALNLQNLILPAGTAKVGDREYLVLVNSSPERIPPLNDLPIKTVNGATVYMKDIGQVHDGYAVQTNIVRVNGGRSCLLTVLKLGNVSTLAIVSGVKKRLPQILAGLTPELHVSQLFDQSIFVRASIQGVLREGAIAATLTGLMILLFIGSWRSTLIVCTSIPLSILTSIIVLNFLGETINVMTLGGLALAVGILVDDATVELENVHRNMAMKKPIVRAILDGAQQIAVPAFVSTLSICIVFVPVLLLTGAAKYLFTPMAMAVVFAMLTSYLLTRTLVPTMVHYMLPPEVRIYQIGEETHAAETRNLVWRVHYAFERQFERMRKNYRAALTWVLDHRLVVIVCFGLFCLGSLTLSLVIGRDFFPYVDAGQMRMHVRTPVGTRIEETAQIFGRVEEEIRRLIPAEELDTILDNIGLPNSGISLVFGDIATISDYDGDILISLKPKHRPTQEYERQFRTVLPAKFPNETFYFQAANITNQILNFGLPAAIDVQVVGNNAQAGYNFASQIQKQVAAIPGAVDVRIRQDVDYPSLRVNVDRTKADQTGLTQRDVASSMLISLSSSFQTGPNFWLNTANGVEYQVAVQTPQYRVDTFDAIRRTPITPAISGGASQLLDNLAHLERGISAAVVSHYDVQPVFDVYANVDQRDLGSVASAVTRIMDSIRPHLPGGTTLVMRGQVETMQSSFVRLGAGMIFAILLVYLLMAINFQSWTDPFIILMALPGAMSGMLWMLFCTQTTFNVPSLMGAIMAVGVATANSILLVVFANDARAEGKSARDAAIEAGFTRIRPVTMTALAMIIGMLPMAFALGEGGEQNAPLGRAVIGGLLVATVTTLFFVPIIYTYFRKKPPVDFDQQVGLEEREGLNFPET
jgi:multidrug efflux pump subunit AcrB